jgi:tetratricopeptide (TPR) repeat protein
MAAQAINLDCPGCGFPVSLKDEICPACGRKLVISTFNSVSAMSMPELNKSANAYRKALASDPENSDVNMSLGFCYLKLKLYDKAIPCFEKAIENNFDNSELYFYTAVALLRGKKAFLTLRPEIDKILQNLEAAVSIEPRGIYYYFMAYIKQDYFARKAFVTTPNYTQLLEQANQVGLPSADVETLWQLLGVTRPDCM